MSAMSLLARVLYMVLFGFVLSLLGTLVGVVAIVQLVLRIATGRPEAALARFGAGVGRYASQVVEFLTFASETLPFPFSDWPAVPTRLERDDLSNL